MSESPRIRITTSVREQMIQNAREDRPLETCALLLGQDGLIDEYYKMTNTDESEVHFTIDPQEQIRAMKQARDRGKEILGVYHSHPSPSSEAYPSEEDKRYGWPEYVYFILNFQPDETVLKAFEVTEDDVKEREFEVVEP